MHDKHTPRTYPYPRHLTGTPAVPYPISAHMTHLPCTPAPRPVPCQRSTAGESVVRDRFKFFTVSSSPGHQTQAAYSITSPALREQYLASPWCARSELLDESKGEGSSLTRAKLTKVLWAMADSGSTGPFYPVSLSSSIHHARHQFFFLIACLAASFFRVWEILLFKDTERPV